MPNSNARSDAIFCEPPGKPFRQLQGRVSLLLAVRPRFRPPALHSPPRPLRQPRSIFGQKTPHLAKSGRFPPFVVGTGENSQRPQIRIITDDNNLVVKSEMSAINSRFQSTVLPKLPKKITFCSLCPEHLSQFELSGNLEHPHARLRPRAERERTDRPHQRVEPVGRAAGRQPSGLKSHISSSSAANTPACFTRPCS